MKDTKDTARTDSPDPQGRWPALPLDAWRDTKDTVHMYTQVIGKVRLVLAPPEPQWGHVPLYVTTSGLTTSPIPYQGRSFAFDLDFVDHRVVLTANDGSIAQVPLAGQSVATFYRQIMEVLHEHGIDVTISTLPSEVPDPVPFPDDEQHATYDPAWAHRFWQVLVQADRVFKIHRGRFRGKTTPVNFFWGTFDLALSRFSGRPADPPPGSDVIYRLAMDAEEVTAGFWPGDSKFPEPAFFSYTYPKPGGLESAPIRPDAASWHTGIGAFLVRYDDVRGSDSPDTTLLEFLQSTYEAGATLASWERTMVEG